MTTEPQDRRRSLPQLDRLLRWPELTDLRESVGEQLLKEAARTVLSSLRDALRQNNTPDLSTAAISHQVRQAATQQLRPHLQTVINGSGVVVHTNLGRSPLADAALSHMHEVAKRYSNLEYDLEKGERGERYVHVESLLTELTGTEAALVVNNNAAAVLLTLSALAQGREAIVSRGELVEIGGSFRIPDVMRHSGVTLVEVGTTNRTHPADYQQAINEQTAMLVQVHTSNFAIVGFKSAVDTKMLADIAHQADIPLVVDAGSGSLVDFAALGIPGEATVRSYIDAGADLVTFSGDKLLGGPQAGIIVGKREYISQLKKHQLLRALRIDKLTLAALEATLLLYRTPERAWQEIPTLRMMTESLSTLTQRGKRLRRTLRAALPATAEVALCQGTSSPGGGTFPLIELPTILVTIQLPGWSAARLDMTLRKSEPAVIGRVYQDTYHLDVRTLRTEEFSQIASLLSRCMEQAP